MSASLEEVNRNLLDLKKEVEDDRTSTHGRVRDLELWRAEMRGSFRTLTWLVGIGLGLPGFALGLIALFMYGGS